MRLIFIHLVLLVIFAAEAKGQQKKAPRQAYCTDTVSALFSMCGTIRGDTVMFNYPNNYEGLKRFFYRNLRYPLDSVQKIPCKLFFIINKEGVITNAWCTPGPPDTITREVVRVAKKIGLIKPSFVKGIAVATRVETRIVYYESNKVEELSLEEATADIVLELDHGCRLPADRGHPH
jgi:hypothetical protein